MEDGDRRERKGERFVNGNTEEQEGDVHFGSRHSVCDWDKMQVICTSYSLYKKVWTGNQSTSTSVRSQRSKFSTFTCSTVACIRTCVRKSIACVHCGLGHGPHGYYMYTLHSLSQKKRPEEAKIITLSEEDAPFGVIPIALHPLGRGSFPVSASNRPSLISA